MFNAQYASLFAYRSLGKSNYSYAGEIGSRNIVRGQGQFNVDMSLNKRFILPFKESHSLQLRWEVFNVANTVRFDINNASLDVGNTGTFGMK